MDYVSSVQAKEVVVVCRTHNLRRLLRQTGGRREFLRPSRWRVQYANENELASALTSLRDAGFAFSGAPAGWPPAAVFEHLRERGLVSGRFTEVVWRGPGKPEFRQM